MSNSNDQTISTPETREREVAALKHQVRDMANERNKAEQDVRDLRAEVEGLKQANITISEERRTAREACAAQRVKIDDLTAQLAQVERDPRDEYMWEALLTERDTLQARVTALTEALKKIAKPALGGKLQQQIAQQALAAPEAKP